MLTKTISRSKEDTLYFLLVLITLLLGFVGMANLSFGFQVEEFASFGSAFRVCFEIIIGEFDLESMRESDPVMAVFFFFSYNILFVFILTNIFLAIIDMAYSSVQEEKRVQGEDVRFCPSLFYCFITLDNRRPPREPSQFVHEVEKEGHNDDTKAPSYLEMLDSL